MLTICEPGDGVCGAALVVTAQHLTYQDDVPDAVAFIASRVEAVGGAGSGSSTESTGTTDSSSETSSDSESSSGLGDLFGGFSFGSRK